MNGRRAKALRRAEGPRPKPSYRVIRTRPLIATDAKGRTRPVGHGDPDSGLLLTVSGNESVVPVSLLDGSLVEPTKAHLERRDALRRLGKRGRR